MIISTVNCFSQYYLYAFGSNENGSLGIGKDNWSFEKINNNQNWIQIESGKFHSLALKSDGTLWAWGRNNFGQLGNNTTEDSYLPIQIGSNNDWIFVECADNSSFAIKKDGTLWAWGNNNKGVLGLGNNSLYKSPAKVPNFYDCIKVSSTNNHTFALKKDASLWAWGDDSKGQIPNFEGDICYIPIEAAPNKKWKDISCGAFHSILISYDGTLWAVGSNSHCQLGVSLETKSDSLIEINSDTNWISVSAGDKHSLALKSNGKVWAWGANDANQLGRKKDNSLYVPTPVPNIDNCIKIKTHSNTSSALCSNSELFIWGPKPAPPFNIDTTTIIAQNVLDYSIGNYFLIAQLNDNKLYSLGLNLFGNLGLGYNSYILSPTLVTEEDEWKSVYGNDYICALKYNNSLWSWGPGSEPYLSSSPIKFDQANNWKDVSVNMAFYSAIKLDSSLWIWGYNTLYNGYLNEPIQIEKDKKWIAVSSGVNYNLALDADSLLWEWGEYESLMGKHKVSKPSIVDSSLKWKKVKSNSYINIGICSNNNLWAWGSVYGAYPNEFHTQNRPNLISNDSDWADVNFSSNDILLIKKDGSLWGYQVKSFLEKDSLSGSIKLIDSNKVWLKAAPYNGTYLGIKKDGSLWIWGSRIKQFLNVGVDTLLSPLRIGNNNDWVDVFISSSSAWALKKSKIQSISDIHIEDNLITYPNPASNQINIQLQNVDCQGKIKILNLLGETVYEDQYWENEIKTIDIGFLNSGTYFIIMNTTDNRLFGCKFVKN